MKKLLVISLLVIALILIWYGESRKFYCFENKKCITVWKTYNGICYIIPGKYCGIIKPSKNYIESSNSNLLTIYFTGDLPNTIIYKSEEDIKVINTNKIEFTFYDYNTDVVKFDSLLYIPNATKNNDIKDNVRLIDLFIGENYAIDKNGKRL